MWRDGPSRFDLVNGRMMENEPNLYRGKWFGSGISTREGSLHAEIPCFIELNLPRKRVITHIVIAEDPRWRVPRVFRSMRTSKAAKCARA